MKFLCLAGIGMNAEVTFRKQLLPIILDLERDGQHSFHCMAGSVKLADSEEMEGHYGLAPHLRFLESAWPGATDQQLNDAVRGAPSGMRPEEKIRYIERRLPHSGVWLQQQDVILGIHRKFVEEGPFDCILGYSEGASIAATFVVDSLAKCAEGGNIVTPRCAVFLNGCTPWSMDTSEPLLADKDGQVITIPTCHILAHNDVMAYASTALYHLCDEELATILDHGRGHSIPRDVKTCKLVTTAIRDLVDRTENAANVENFCTEESQ